MTLNMGTLINSLGPIVLAPIALTLLFARGIQIERRLGTTNELESNSAAESTRKNWRQLAAGYFAAGAIWYALFFSNAYIAGAVIAATCLILGVYGFYIRIWPMRAKGASVPDILSLLVPWLVFLAAIGWLGMNHLRTIYDAA